MMMGRKEIGGMAPPSILRKLSGLLVNLGKSIRGSVNKSPAVTQLPSRIRKLAQLSRAATRVRPTDYNKLESWVHNSQKVVVIGEAAHPFPVRFLICLPYLSPIVKVLGN